MTKLSWESSESHLFINPSYSNLEKARYLTILKASSLRGHIWLATSGSSATKWVGLSKEAILLSAEAVNTHLKSQKEDRWINALPVFHIGGLSIWARAYLSGATVCDFKKSYPCKWSALVFYQYLQQEKGTLTSLVPTQLYDLVTLGLKAPKSLRAVIVGGGELIASLYDRAIALDWPILPSYGMTECASQIATAPLCHLNQFKMPSLQLLSHIAAREENERLCFYGNSLLTAYAYVKKDEVTFSDPKINGWLLSDDRGIIDKDTITLGCRMDEIIKIGGESVDMKRLDAHLQTLCLQMDVREEFTLIAMPDSRLGQAIHLVSNIANKEKIIPVIQKFQQTVLPFEKIRRFTFVHKIPRSPLNKILRKELMRMAAIAPSIEL